MLKRFTAILAGAVLGLSLGVAGVASANTVPAVSTTLSAKAAVKAPPPSGTSSKSSIAAKNPICAARPNGACYFYAGRGQNFTTGTEIKAVQANIRVETPALDLTNDYHSVTEMSLESGTSGTSNYQVVEIGWQISPPLYGDSNPHLFTYSWVNGVGMGYNATNPNWIDDTTNPINAGSSLASASGTAKQFLVQYDAPSNYWWFYYNGTSFGKISGTQWTGASPSATFVKATRVQYFGEVPSDCTNPYTDMGSGSAGSLAALPAAYFASITYDTGAATVNPNITTQTNTAYYTVGTTVSPRTFYFGGAGAGSGIGPC